MAFSINPFFLFIIGMIILSLLAALAYIVNKRSESKEEYNHIFQLTKQGNGHVYGRELKNEQGVYFKRKITFKPQDISIGNIKDAGKIKPVEIIADPDEYIVLPRGSCSQQKNIIFIVPNDLRELPPEILDTPFGKKLMFAQVFASADSTIQNAMIEGFNRQKLHIENLAYGEVSELQINQIKSAAKDVIELYKEAKKEKSIIPNKSPGEL